VSLSVSAWTSFYFAFAVQVRCSSAASAAIASAVALAFLTVAIFVLASVTKLAAHPAIAALFTFFAVAAPIININAPWAKPKALRGAGSRLDEQAA